MTSAPSVAASAAAQRPATFRDVFAVAEFRVIFGSFGIFLGGETVKMLALSVLVYESTGSSLISALAFSAGFLPHALGGIFLLALADRLPPRAVIVGYDLVRLALVVVLALGVLPPVGMLGLVVLVGVFGPVSSAARTALLPDILDGDAYVLGRSLLTVASGATQVIGFAVGGLLLSLVGPYGALWLTAATCAITALLVQWGLRPRPARQAVSRPTPTPGPDKQTGGRRPPRNGAIRETWRGNRELFADRRIRGLLLAQWLPGALMVGAEGVAVPYAAELGPGASAGVLLMAGATGMLVADLVVGRFVPPAARERLTPWLALLLGVPMLAFLLEPGLVVAATLFAVATAGFAYHLGLARRFLDAVPEERRGQAFGLSSVGLMTVQGVAVAGAGVVGDLTSPAVAMALAGACSLAATVLLWRYLTPPAQPENRPVGPTPVG